MKPWTKHFRPVPARGRPRVHHPHDHPGPALQEGAARADQGRARVPLRAPGQPGAASARPPHACPGRAARARHRERAAGALDPGRGGESARPAAPRRARADRGRRAAARRERPALMYAGLGATLVLAAFAAASAAAALALRVLGPRLRVGTAGLPAARRSHNLATLRLLPSALSLLLAGGLVAPAYLAREPRDAGETPGLLLGILAALGTLLVVTSAARILASWRATRRLVVEWRSAARPLDLPGAPAPIFRTRSAFPVVAAVGVLRPRLFVAAQVLEGLAEDERDAVLAHEAAHLRARDNLTGLLLRACPDGFVWGREAAEQAADEHAALGAPGRAASLAAALVKVARMVPQGAHLGLPAAALHGGEAVADRVARLLRLSRAGRPRTEARGRRTRNPRYVLLGASLLLGLAAHAPVLALVHAAIERVVRSLP